MPLKSVFYSLQEVFPQIDLRILKAVASEHTEDADAAVEFVLSEVLPCTSESKEPSYTHDNTYHTEHSLANAGMNKQNSLLGHHGTEENTSLLPEPSIVCGSAISDNYTSAANTESSCIGEAENKGSYVEHVSWPNKPSFLLGKHQPLDVNASLSSQEKLMEDALDHIFEHATNDSHTIPDSLGEIAMDTSPSSILVHDQLSIAEHGKAVNMVEQIVEPCQGPHRVAKNETVSLDSNIQELHRNEPTDTVTSVVMQAQKFSSSILEDSTDIMEPSVAVEKDINGHESVYSY